MSELRFIYNKITSGKYIAWYFIGVILFPYLFDAIKPYYLDDLCACPHAIDEHPLKTFDFFNGKYILSAKSCYNIPEYYFSFFILDFIFPIVYSIFFLSVIRIWEERKPYLYFQVLIVAGFLFDYLENFFFAYFLRVGDNDLSSLISSFSSIKSFLFIINMVIVFTALVKLITRGAKELVGKK